MNKTSSQSDVAGMEFRGHNGWEYAERPDLRTGCWLKVGTGVAALIIFAVIFVTVPQPGGGGHGAQPLARRCMDNSACSASGLLGDCCPTAQGLRLGCCIDPSNVITPTRTARGACDDNSECAGVGLLGACCPTAGGTALACCTSPNNTVTPPRQVSAQCSLNRGCALLGLHTGNCCPADDGGVLGCCPTTASSAAADAPKSPKSPRP
ncbi:hypothetical protein M885DRAFT_529279 [Pelagophyceae sp. CCMP2097]|nr:hypothetical protein M885DRAFT_529279 [Pelagophyceae sp. CCMP2097]